MVAVGVKTVIIALQNMVIFAGTMAGALLNVAMAGIIAYLIVVVMQMYAMMHTKAEHCGWKAAAKLF
jgi:hypothetical protein